MSYQVRNKIVYHVIMGLHSGIATITIAILVNKSLWAVVFALLYFLAVALIITMWYRLRLVKHNCFFPIIAASCDKSICTNKLLKILEKNGVITFYYMVDGNVIYDGTEDECPDHIRKEISEYRMTCMN